MFSLFSGTHGTLQSFQIPGVKKDCVSTALSFSFLVLYYKQSIYLSNYQSYLTELP